MVLNPTPHDFVANHPRIGYLPEISQVSSFFHGKNSGVSPGGRARLGRGGAAAAATLGGDPADATAEPEAAEVGWKAMERVETTMVEPWYNHGIYNSKKLQKR